MQQSYMKKKKEGGRKERRDSLEQISPLCHSKLPLQRQHLNETQDFFLLNINKTITHIDSMNFDICIYIYIIYVYVYIQYKQSSYISQNRTFENRKEKEMKRRGRKKRLKRDLEKTKKKQISKQTNTQLLLSKCTIKYVGIVVIYFDAFLRVRTYFHCPFLFIFIIVFHAYHRSLIDE